MLIFPVFISRTAFRVVTACVVGLEDDKLLRSFSHDFSGAKRSLKMASCDLSSLLGENLIRGVGAEKVDVNSLLGDGKVIGFYFSAHWCPPCKAFTPILAEFYNNFKKGEHGDKLEIIFVSSDKTDESFDEYFKEMPWLALPYKERAKTVSDHQIQNLINIIRSFIIDINQNPHMY